MSNSPPAPITFISSQDFVFPEDGVEPAVEEPTEGGGRMSSTSTTSSNQKGRMTGSANSRMNSKASKSAGESFFSTPTTPWSLFQLSFLLNLDSCIGTQKPLSTFQDPRRTLYVKVFNSLVQLLSISRLSAPKLLENRILRLVPTANLANGNLKKHQSIILP